MRKFVFILMGIVLVACQPVTVKHHPERPMPVSVRVDDAALWLEEWHQVVGLPQDQIELTLSGREVAFASHVDPRSRMRLVLLLTAGPAPVRDQKRARDLIGDMDTARASESTRALAALLQQSIEEQLWSGDRISKLKGELSQADARISELEQQLQALTSIEQSIQQRETPGNRKEK